MGSYGGDRVQREDIVSQNVDPYEHMRCDGSFESPSADRYCDE